MEKFDLESSASSPEESASNPVVVWELVALLYAVGGAIARELRSRRKKMKKGQFGS